LTPKARFRLGHELDADLISLVESVEFDRILFEARNVTSLRSRLRAVAGMLIIAAKESQTSDDVSSALTA
jgi:hypothetical protein